MDLKEVANRLEIIKLSIPINDKETIALQSEKLKLLNDIKLKEIAILLEKKSYRQALYLIKKYIEDNDIFIEADLEKSDSDKENVLNVEDMLKMSPIAKETIEEFKKKSYTEDDLRKFAKNIIKPKVEPSVSIDSNETKEKIETSYKVKDKLQEQNKEDIKNKKDSENSTLNNKVEIDIKAQEAISEASKDTPLDEMSSKILSKKSKQRARVLSKYKTLRSKFSKEKTFEQEENKEVKQEKIYKDDIYPPIAHIEEKFRQSFAIYSPLKENDIWMEEVAKFLKFVSLNSYKDSDVEKFLDDYFHYKEKGDIARASQVLLLAAATEAKYPQFLLARELFKGKLFKRNIKASFSLMTKLANSGYADAICDLGQFYEYGVGVEENKKIALKLYEKAFELGLQRATKHINRIKESSSIFGSLKKIFG